MDISFSLDENDISDNLPPSCSTPKRPQKQFECDVCKKKYISNFHFNRHLVTHTTASTNESAVNVSQISLSSSDINISSVLRNDAPRQNGVFKVPNKPKPAKKKVKPTLTCNYCGKGYVCKKSYQTHTMTHAVQEAAARYPPKDAILENAPQICAAVLVAVFESPCGQESGKIFRTVCNHFLGMQAQGNQQWEDFSSAICGEVLDCVVGERFILPSALLSALVTQIEVILADEDMCLNLLCILEVSHLFDEEVLRLFLLEFLLNLAKEMLLFISKTIRNYSTIQPPKQLAVIEQEDREVIYFIGGSIVCGYLRMARRFHNNDKWVSLSQVLRTRVLSDDPSKESDSSWTAALDRGGLLYVSSEFQEFLLELTKVIVYYQMPDGSIDFIKILEVVSESHLCLLWDSIISNALPQKVSLNLMNDVVKMFCNTCGRAFALQKLNVLRARPVVSMGVRHLAASRRNRN